MLNRDVLNEFLFDCKMRKLSDRTIKSYENNNIKMFHYIENEFNILELEATQHQAIIGYISYLTNLGRKETYINGIIKCIRAYFKYCINEGYIPKNPMDKVKFQKEPLTLIETFNDKEVKNMIACFSEKDFLNIRNKLILIVLFDTGLRCSELCRLKLTDIHETFIHVIGKGNKTRHAPITPIMNKYIIKYLRIRQEYLRDKFQIDAEYLFISNNGKILTVEAIENIVYNAGLNANVRPHIRISPHTCRHYYAQAQIRNGCDVYTLSRLLGHTNINITKRYLQSIQDEKIVEMGAKTSPLMNIKL